MKKGTGKGPVVAFLAEYDALRGVGHGCGHNVIATCASGAFASLAKIFVEMGIAGEVWIIGTPAEEAVPERLLCWNEAALMEWILH